MQFTKLMRPVPTWHHLPPRCLNGIGNCTYSFYAPTLRELLCTCNRPMLNGTTLSTPSLAKPSANMSLASTQNNRRINPWVDLSRTYIKWNAKELPAGSQLSITGTTPYAAKTSTHKSNGGCIQPFSNKSVMLSGLCAVQQYIGCNAHCNNNLFHRFY